jgi:hypothetical protein
LLLWMCDICYVLHSAMQIMPPRARKLEEAIYVMYICAF